MLELNRLKYTVGNDLASLKSGLDFEQILRDILLLTPSVKLHSSNSKELYLELMSCRFEDNILEKKGFVFCMVSMTQQLRLSLYFQIQKSIKIVDLPNSVGVKQTKLYHFQPDTQQDHLALLRDLNLNDKLISKEDEKKVLKRKAKFIKLLIGLHAMFVEKIDKVFTSGVYLSVFRT